MADIAPGTELARFTEEVATALFRAVDARPAGSDDLLDRFRVTAGIWIDPREPPKTPEFERFQPRPGIYALSRSEVAGLISRAPLSRESVGRLNDAVGSDPSRALALLKSLASDPSMWDTLFSLDDDRRAALREPDGNDFIPLFEDLVRKIEGFRDDLGTLTFEIAPPTAAARKAAARAAKEDSKPWWAPDEFQLKGTAKDGGWEVSGTLTWKF
jgi:hypothetical protein